MELIIFTYATEIQILSYIISYEMKSWLFTDAPSQNLRFRYIPTSKYEGILLHDENSWSIILTRLLLNYEDKDIQYIWFILYTVNKYKASVIRMKKLKVTMNAKYVHGTYLLV